MRKVGRLAEHAARAAPPEPSVAKLDSNFRVAFTPFHKSTLCESRRYLAPRAGSCG
jgi:hypothetical protein